MESRLWHRLLPRRYRYGTYASQPWPAGGTLWAHGIMLYPHDKQNIGRLGAMILHRDLVRHGQQEECHKQSAGVVLTVAT